MRIGNTHFPNDFVYDTFEISPTAWWTLKKYDRTHLYLYAVEPAIYDLGEYGRIALQQYQWTYIPFPEGIRIQQLMPIYSTFVRVLATDEFLDNIGQNEQRLYEYERNTQAWSVVAGGGAGGLATTVINAYIGLQLRCFTPAPGNIILTKATVDCSIAPLQVQLNLDSTNTPDLALTNQPLMVNHRVDANPLAINNVPSPLIAFTNGATNSTTEVGINSVIRIVGDGNPNFFDLLGGEVRIIPKASIGYFAIYAQFAAIGGRAQINASWYVEL